MNLLAIETATERLSAALLANGKIHERHTDSRSAHCELLSGFIEELRVEAGIALSDIEGVAVSLGPGSFTGLRIGIATAMGLAYGLGIKAVGVNTLMALAWNTAQPQTLVCPLIDAKRSEVYTAVYRMGTNCDTDIPKIVLAPTAIPVPTLAGILETLQEPVTVTGPATVQFSNDLERTGEARLSFIPQESSKPTAAAIVRLGSLLFRLGEDVNPAALKPIYLRRSDAEILRDARRKS